jgi:hypothetical protein
VGGAARACGQEALWAVQLAVITQHRYHIAMLLHLLQCHDIVLRRQGRHVAGMALLSGCFLLLLRPLALLGLLHTQQRASRLGCKQVAKQQVKGAWLRAWSADAQQLQALHCTRYSCEQPDCALLKSA